MDSVDNISGCPGVGEKSPHMKFPGCTNWYEFTGYAKDVYASKKAEHMFAEQYSLVKMLDQPALELDAIPEPNARLVFGTTTQTIEQEPENIVPTVAPVSFMQ